MNQGSESSSAGWSPKKKLRTNANVVVVFLSIIYVGFLLYQSVFFNYQRNEKIKTLKNEIVEFQEKEAKIESLIAYYKTDSFQELEARKKLGLKMPGEKVVKVDVRIDDRQSINGSSDQAVAARDQAKDNLELWFEFVTGELNKF